MNKIFTIVLFSLFSLNSFGTAQIPDKIIIKGDTLSLFAFPLNSFPNKDFINPRGLFGSKGCFYTACWRNYIATWEVIDNELFLREIKNACYPTKMSGVSASYKAGIEKDSIGTEFADLETLFPQRFKDGKVKADWVNGKLVSPKGTLLHYIHAGFQSIYENELEYTFERGILTETKTFDNSKTKISKYTKDKKLLRNFIDSNIIRENLPETDSLRRKVYVSIISSDDKGKIDSIKILRGVNELYDKEAIRIIKSIPEWDVIYRHGKKINQGWTISVNFDLTEKDEE